MLPTSAIKYDSIPQIYAVSPSYSYTLINPGLVVSFIVVMMKQTESHGSKSMRLSLSNECRLWIPFSTFSTGL